MMITSEKIALNVNTTKPTKATFAINQSFRNTISRENQNSTATSKSAFEFVAWSNLMN